MFRAKTPRGTAICAEAAISAFSAISAILAISVIAALAAVAAISATSARTAGAQEPTPAGIEFVVAETPGLDTIYLRSVGSDDPEGLLLVEVWANEVTDLYGLSFSLMFPETLFRFPKARSTVFAEGPFLGESGGADTVLAVRQVGNAIVVGCTRTGQVPGVSGSGLLLTLEFRGRGVAGQKGFRLRHRKAFDSSGAVAGDYSWLSAKAIVTVSAPPD